MSTTTIEQTVDIPADGKIHLDFSLPVDMPRGPAEVKLTVRAKAGERRMPFISWFQDRQMEAKRKAIMEFAGSLTNSPAFKGDPVKIFREMRDEWDQMQGNDET
jgi:hypothetical protein